MKKVRKLVYQHQRLNIVNTDSEQVTRVKDEKECKKHSEIEPEFEYLRAVKVR